MDRGGNPHFIHPSSYVDESASVGAGTKIWHFCHVMEGASIGRGCILGQNTFVGRGVQIGHGVKIQNNVSVYEGVTLGDDVFCGPSVVFTNVKNPRSAVERKAEFRSTLVKRGVSLGANSTILCGITIGEYAFVGAGAVVTKDVPDHSLVVGAPARHVGWMCRCGPKLLKTQLGLFECPECGEGYSLLGDELMPSNNTGDRSHGELT